MQVYIKSFTQPFQFKIMCEPRQDYYKKLQEDIKIIESEMGQDFMTALPMPIEKDGGGIQACYNQADAQTAMASRGCYTSSVSLWWLDLFKPAAAAGVPMNRQRLEDLALYYYQAEYSPKFMTGRQIEVAIHDMKDITEKPGAMLMLSPEELAHSMIVGCANSIRPTNAQNVCLRSELGPKQ